MIMRRLLTLLLLVALACPAIAERRIALVIGNGKYPGSPLSNPANDARDMAAALRHLGFEVIEKSDVSQREMNRAITLFGEKLNADTVAVFFYAGHGLQVRGKNYLVPIDAQIASEASVRSETVDVDAILEQLGSSPLNVVILDACRNNPFERRFRSTGGGLAQMDAPKGTLIAYATAPGKVASDGTGRNGLYTQELLKLLQTPGLPIESVFKRVRANVAKATGDQQVPWEASSLTGDFFFKPGHDNNHPAEKGSTPGQSTAQAARNEAPLELAFWESVEKGNKPADYEAYLRAFPNGRFVELAKLRTTVTDPDEEQWNRVSKSTRAEEVQTYLSRFPQGRFAPQARSLLDDLKSTIRLSKSGLDRLSIMVYNVDDEAYVSMNGKQIREKSFLSPGDDKPVDITASLAPGRNRLELKLINLMMGWSYGFKIFRNDELVFHDECGNKPWGGCKGDSATGIVFKKTLAVEYAE